MDRALNTRDHTNEVPILTSNHDSGEATRRAANTFLGETELDRLGARTGDADILNTDRSGNHRVLLKTKRREVI
jgi:hypothetical protein